MSKQLTVNIPLTEFCASVVPSGVIGTQILPQVKVADVAGTFPAFTRRDMSILESTARPFNGEAGFRDVTVQQKTYNCYPGQAWKEYISDLEMGVATKALQEQMRRTQASQNKILIKQEDRIASKVMAAANHVNTMTLTAGGTSDGYQFDKYTVGKGTLFAIVERLKDMAFNPDPGNCKPYMAMSKDVFTVLKNHPDLIARVAAGTRDMPSKVAMTVMADLFEVEEVFVGDVSYDSTSKKATPTYTTLWTWNMLYFYRAVNPHKNAASFGYTFMFAPNVLGDEQVTTQSPEFTGIKDGWRVRTYRDEARGGGSNVVEVEAYPDEQIVMSDAAALIVNAIGSKVPV